MVWWRPSGSFCNGNSLDQRAFTSLPSIARADGVVHRQVSHRLGPGYRIYLGRDGDRLIILLGGGTKQRQQTDIEQAKAMWAEYKGRKAAAAKPRGRG